MVVIVLAWVLLFLVLASLGAGVYAVFVRVLGSRYQASPGIFQLVWAGFAALLGLLQISSLFVAIDGRVLAAVSALALASAFLSLKHVRQGLAPMASAPFRRKAAWAACILVIALAAAYNSALPLRHSDTDLYHLNAVKWANEYPAVPGLVNLHCRLAFNSSFYMFAALSNNWIWDDRAVHVSNGFLVLMVALQWLSILAGGGRRGNVLGRAFAIATTPLVATMVFGNNISSLSTDLFMFSMALAAAYETMSLRCRGMKGRRAWLNIVNRRNFFSWLVITALSAALLTVKLSGLPIFIVIMMTSLVLFIVLRRSGHFPLRQVLLLCALPAILAVGFVGRNVVLSGWLLYPAPYGNLHLEWSATDKEAVDLMRVIKAWARVPRQPLDEVLDHGFMHWFAPWFQKVRTMFPIAFILLFAGVAGSIYLSLSNAARGLRADKGPPLFICLLFGLMGIAYWFLTAPDYRFGEIFFWIFAGSALSPVLSVLLCLGTSSGFSAGVAVGVSLTVLMSFQWSAMSPRLDARPSFLSPPPPAAGKVIRFEVENGQKPKLFAYSPAKGLRCGNSPLPCGPSIDSDTNIELRIPGKLEGGFRRFDKFWTASWTGRYPDKWTGKEAGFNITVDRGRPAGRLHVFVKLGPEALRRILPLKVAVSGNGKTVELQLEEGRADHRVDLAQFLRGNSAEVTLSVSKAWRPVDVGIGRGTRELGVMAEYEPER